MFLNRSGNETEMEVDEQDEKHEKNSIAKAGAYKNRVKDEDEDEDKDDYDTYQRGEPSDEKSKSLFEHVLELIPLQRPTVDILRQIRSISTSSNTASMSTSSRVDSSDNGGFINGIMIASDILHIKTKSKKYNRKIVLITDGEHRINDISYRHMDIVLQALLSFFWQKLDRDI